MGDPQLPRLVLHLSVVMVLILLLQMLLDDEFHNFDVLQLWPDRQLLLHRLRGCINPLLNHTLFQDRLPPPLFRLNTRSSLALTIFRHAHQRCSELNHLFKFPGLYLKVTPYQHWVSRVQLVKI